MIYRPLATAVAAVLVLAACGQKDTNAPGAATPAAPKSGLLTPAEFPHPSPGLWEMKMSMAKGDKEASPTSRICYDEAFAKEMGLTGQQVSAEMGCKPSMSRQLDGSIKMTTTCTSGPDGKPMQSTAIVRGDFKTAYSIEIVPDVEDPADDGPMTAQATRLGDCPADFKPGDMEVAGMRMNLKSKLGGPEAPAAPAP